MTEKLLYELFSFQPLCRDHWNRHWWSGRTERIPFMARYYWWPSDKCCPETFTSCVILLLDGLSSQVTQRATELNHGFLSVVGFFLLQITLTIWPPTPAKHMADFAPNSCPRELCFAVSNKMERCVCSFWSVPFYWIRYYLCWDLASKGQNLQCLVASTIDHKAFGYIFLL